MDGDKIIYGLSHVCISKWDAATGKYGTPKAIKGAVSIELNPLIDKVEPTIGKGVKETIIERLNGFDGTIELQIVPSWFYVDVFGDTLDDKGAMYVTSKRRNLPTFALLFEFKTDSHARRFVFYNCKYFRPSIAGKTTSDKLETQKEKFDIQIRPRRDDDKIYNWTTSDIDTDIYNDWFNTVY
jgi:phage major tail protein, phi13 family